MHIAEEKTFASQGPSIQNIKKSYNSTTKQQLF